MPKRLVILDTSFLIACAESKIDFVAELTRVLPFAFEPAVLEKTLEEFQRAAARKKKGKKEAVALAKTLIRKKRLRMLRNGNDARTADALILERAKKNKTVVVATIDTALRRRLKRIGIDTVMVRQRRHLEYQQA